MQNDKLGSADKIVGSSDVLYDCVKRSIQRHIAPSELVGECSKHGKEWRALVAVTPSGPLTLMAFKIVV